MKPLISILALGSLVLFLGSCSGMPLVGDRVKADVDLAGEMTEVQASANPHSEASVKYLRTEDWKKAADELKMAHQEESDNMRTAFALGVAYEKAGMYKEALDAYQSANLLAGKTGRAPITAAVLRMKEKTGTK